MGREREGTKFKKFMVNSTAAVVGLAGIGVYQQREGLTLAAQLAISNIAHDRGPTIAIDERTDPNFDADKPFIETYNNLSQNFKMKNGLLLSSTDRSGYALIWPYGRALDASYTATLIPNIGERYKDDYQEKLAGLEKYWNTEPKGYKAGYDPGIVSMNFTDRTERYTDDNLWIGLILARDYQRSGNVKHLEQAKQVFEMAISQWDHTGGGGIFWKQQFPEENTDGKVLVSNGPTATLGVYLYQATENPYYLEWSERIVDWTDKKLKDHVEHIYSDNTNGNDVGRAKFTYCQGVMIGALTKLHEIKPEKYPLKNAVELANSSMDYFGERTEGYSSLRFDPIFFQNALFLASKYNNAPFTEKVKENLEQAVNDLGIANSYDDLLDQSSAAQLRALQRLTPNEYRLLL